MEPENKQRVSLAQALRRYTFIEPGETLSIREAAEDLLRDLQNGKLVATGIRTENLEYREKRGIEAIPPDLWRGISPEQFREMAEFEFVMDLEKPMDYSDYWFPTIAADELVCWICRDGRAQSASDDVRSAVVPSERAGDLFRRRGRKPRYSWQDFAAEMIRRSHAEPIRNQAALEEHMAQWCAENWNCEPSSSVIREWVGPTFKAIEASMGECKPANGADTSPPEFPVNPPPISG